MATAAFLWLGVLLASSAFPGMLVGGLFGAAVAVAAKRPQLIVVLIIGIAVGLFHSSRVERTLSVAVPEGPHIVGGVLAGDVYGGVAMFKVLPGADVAAVPILLRTSEPVEAGDRLVVAGTLSDTSGRWRGQAYAGVLAANRIVEDLGPVNRWYAVAGALRHRVTGVFDGVDQRGSALVRGFLIGDTSRLSPVELAQLKDAGLSHYVAVSGSNVALFLALVWVLAGPLSFDVRSRAIVGAGALVVFTLVTRWEASVVRASVMAGLMLGARAVGYPLRGWTALGAAVTGLLVVSPELATAVGFQLSVAATAGVMAGSNLFPGIPLAAVRRSLAAAVGAQVAVAPLLLLWFGSVPLASPLANLAAAPFVAASTALGGVAGLTGFGPIATVASRLAGVVLEISETAATGPQLGPLGAAVVGATFLIPWRNVRRLTIAGSLTLLAFGSMGTALPRSTVAFLDIGQGDAALIKAGDGSVMLIDGGPDPTVLLDHLNRYRVDRIAVMVVSHAHEDHIGGLVVAAETRPVDQLWHPGHVDESATFQTLVETTAAGGGEIVAPAAGDRYRLGDLMIEVMGPLRRYASANDQSLVLRISSSTISVLFAGDIEEIAQRELGVIEADVLKVPHHGGATSHLDWLGATGAAWHIVSVGANPFGHPAGEVMDVLSAAGACVHRTDESGNVVVRLDEPIARQLAGSGCGKS